MRLLRLDPFSGASGDMFVAALAVLADAEGELAAIPAKLGLEGVEVRFRSVQRCALQARKFDVLYRGELAEEVTGDHGRRTLAAILELLAGAALPAGVGERAAAIFRLLGEAEAAVHGASLEGVHFHEAGALDAIVDVAAAAWLIDRLAVDRVLCEPVCTGFGTVATAHGELPVPGPATELLLRGFPLRLGREEGEWVTPTGAAILRHLAPAFERPALRFAATAYGAGARDLGSRPNVLRASLCHAAAPEESETAVLLATNIDDMPGELLGEDLLARILEAGALDVVARPVTMKKGRPGVQLEVLSPPGAAERLALFLLEHTSTLGVRTLPVERRTLPRDRVSVDTPFGSIRVKRAELPSGGRRGLPEFEDCREAARRAGVPVQRVYQAALAAFLAGEG